MESSVFSTDVCIYPDDLKGAQQLSMAVSCMIHQLGCLVRINCISLRIFSFETVSRLPADTKPFIEAAALDVCAPVHCLWHRTDGGGRSSIGPLVESQSVASSLVLFLA